MNRYKWLYVVLIGVLLLGLVPAEVTEAQGLDLNRHCRQHGRERAVNIDGTAYGWRCEDSSGNLHSISIQDACNEQYGSGYRAEFRDMNDQNSWYCARESQPENPPPQNPPPAAQANPQPQQSQSSAPVAQPAIVTDGCTDHPEQVYAGSSSPPGGDYLRVNVANLRVRMGPSTSWCMNGYAVQGRYYPVHEVRDGWALITGTYGAGWLATGYVTLYGSYASHNPAPAPNPAPASSGTLIASCEITDRWSIAKSEYGQNLNFLDYLLISGAPSPLFDAVAQALDYVGLGVNAAALATSELPDRIVWNLRLNGDQVSLELQRFRSGQLQSSTVSIPSQLDVYQAMRFCPGTLRRFG